MLPLHDDNPTHIRPYVTWTIIGLCVVIFLWQFSLDARGGREAVYGLGLIPSVLFGENHLPPQLAHAPAILTPITSMFLHGGWMHLIGNMLFLWVFGNNIEDAMGHWRYIGFYLLAGLAAAGGQIASDPSSVIPMIGASGAISGVLGAYLMLYPKARVLMLVWLGFLVTTIRVPALIVLGLWIVMQIFNATLSGGGGGGVAWWAHIGGFIAGMALIPLFRHKHIPLFGHGYEGHGRGGFARSGDDPSRKPFVLRTGGERPAASTAAKGPWKRRKNTPPGPPPRRNKPGPWGRRR